jgi:anti-anti-sigma factor
VQSAEDLTEWLRVELETNVNSSTMAISGVLSGTSIAALEAQIDQLGSTPCEDVVLDLRHLRALDRRGAMALVGLYHYVKARGGQLRILGARPRIAGALLQVVLHDSKQVDGEWAAGNLGSFQWV